MLNEQRLYEIAKPRNKKAAIKFKLRRIMKDFWKKWQFWAIVAAVIIAIVGVILYFTVPAFKAMILEIAAGILIFVVGWLVGHFIC